MQNEETAMRNARDDGVTVRPATEGDAALLLGLNREVQALHAAAEPGRFKPVVTDTAPFVAMVNTPEAQTYIADVAGTPAGYVHIVVQRRPENPFTYAATIVHIDQIAVCSAYRRHGVAPPCLTAPKPSPPNSPLTASHSMSGPSTPSPKPSSPARASPPTPSAGD
jgi:hypothetical protein